MNLKHSKHNSYHIIEATGRLDVTTAGDFEGQVNGTIDEGNTQLVIDMSGIEYISSAGLRSILLAAKKVKAEKGDLRFSGLNGMVEEVFTISGFKSMFRIFDNISSAVSS